MKTHWCGRRLMVDGSLGQVAAGRGAGRLTQRRGTRTYLLDSSLTPDVPSAKRSSPADPQVGRILDRMDPALAPIARLVRHIVRREAPERRETVKWGMPGYAGRKNVCYIAAYSAHVNLGFYRGVELADPDHLLEGSGKSLRHVKIRSSQEASTPAIGRLLRAAVSKDRE